MSNSSALLSHTHNSPFFRFVRDALPKPDSQQGVLLNNFVAGAIGGTAGTILNTPFDVVKSRVQNQISAPFKYNWAIPAIRTIAMEEGFGALYKGNLKIINPLHDLPLSSSPL